MKRIVFVATLVIIIGAGWLIYKQNVLKKAHVAKVSEPATSTSVKWNEVLRNELANPGERATGLMKLARAKDPLALEFGKKWLGSTSEVEGDAAIQALPHFEDSQVLELLKQSWPRLNEVEKLHLLTALVENSTEARRSWIAELGKDEKSAPGVLAKFLTQGTVKDLVGAIGRLPETAQQRLMGLLVLRAPEDTALIDWLIQVADKGTSESMKAFAIRSLGMAKAKKYSPQLKKMAQSKAVDIRSAALEVIPELCPSDRWEIMNETAKRENNQLVLRRLLDSLSYLKGQEANRVLQLVQGREASLIASLKLKIEETKKDLEVTHIANRCDR